MKEELIGYDNSQNKHNNANLIPDSGVRLKCSTSVACVTVVALDDDGDEYFFFF